MFMLSNYNRVNIVLLYRRIKTMFFVMFRMELFNSFNMIRIFNCVKISLSDLYDDIINLSYILLLL